MKYQSIMFEVPALSDEGAAAVFKFFEALMHGIDDAYYKQIHHYYANQLEKMMKDEQTSQEAFDNDPPF